MYVPSDFLILLDQLNSPGSWFDVNSPFLQKSFYNLYNLRHSKMFYFIVIIIIIIISLHYHLYSLSLFQDVLFCVMCFIFCFILGRVFCCCCCLLLFLGHGWWCLELTPGFVLKDHSWWIPGVILNTRDWTCKASFLPTVVELQPHWYIFLNTCPVSGSYFCLIPSIQSGTCDSFFFFLIDEKDSKAQWRYLSEVT